MFLPYVLIGLCSAEGRLAHARLCLLLKGNEEAFNDFVMHHILRMVFDRSEEFDAASNDAKRRLRSLPVVAGMICRQGLSRATGTSFADRSGICTRFTDFKARWVGRKGHQRTRNRPADGW